MCRKLASALSSQPLAFVPRAQMPESAASEQGALTEEVVTLIEEEALFVASREPLVESAIASSATSDGLVLITSHRR